MFSILIIKDRYTSMQMQIDNTNTHRCRKIYVDADIQDIKTDRKFSIIIIDRL